MKLNLFGNKEQIVPLNYSTKKTSKELAFINLMQDKFEGIRKTYNTDASLKIEFGGDLERQFMLASDNFFARRSAKKMTWEQYRELNTYRPFGTLYWLNDKDVWIFVCLSNIRFYIQQRVSLELLEKCYSLVIRHEIGHILDAGVPEGDPIRNNIGSPLTIKETDFNALSRSDKYIVYNQFPREIDANYFANINPHEFGILAELPQLPYVTNGIMRGFIEEN